MNSTDLAILAALEGEGRQSFASLAEKLSMSKTPCWNRVQNLEDQKAILGYNAHINALELGLSVVAMVHVMIDFPKRDEFENAVSTTNEIVECHTTAGEFDYIMKILCKDVDDLDDVLRYRISTLPGVSRSSTMICLRSVKSRGSVVAAARRLHGKAR